MVGDKKMLLLLLLLAVHLVPVPGSVIYSLNGDDWMVSGSNITVPARVPGGIYTDLMRAGQIGDPLYRMNDVSLRWVALANWTYTKTFNVDSDTLNHKAIYLVAEGLDTVASVYLNEVLVFDANNMFRRYQENVTKVLKVGANIIRVEFKSPVTYALDQAKRSPYEVPPGCPPSVQNGECHFNFIRKEACSFSWDWGPSFPSMGIWKNITLEAYDERIFERITVDIRYLWHEMWEVLVTMYMNVDFNATVSFVVAIDELGQSFDWLVNNTSEYPIWKYYVTFDQVEPWWPNGLGNPKLYDMVVAFKYKNAVEYYDPRTIRTGFRKVELVEDAVGGVESGYSFYFKINNVPVFIKGSNWIPADSFQERITPSYLEKLLGSAADANMNMLRVWGGGVYESDEFYEIADRLGIMIWQDFMYACALYPVDDGFLLNVGQEVIHQVRRLRNHASIVIWSGNNENEGALSNNWFNVSPAQFKQFSADYKKLYIDTIRRHVMEEDKYRPFVPSSPSNGLDTAQEGWIAKDPQSIRYGDIHYYNYDGDTWNWRTFPMPRFASEFGIQSWCSMETLLPVSDPVDRDIGSDFVAHRQHHDQGNEEIRDEIAMHMKLPTSSNRTQHFIDFIYLSQINQAVGIKTEVEFYRRSQVLHADGRGLTMGALYWQLNDIWQAPTWASIEYGGKWKMLHYHAKRFFSNSLISPIEEDGLLKVYYIDDLVWLRNYKPPYRDPARDPLGQGGPRGGEMDGSQGSQKKDVVRMVEKVVVENLEEAEAKIELRIRCFHWSSMEERKTWKVSVKQPSKPIECIHMSRLIDMMADCGCSDPSRCFFHFSAALTGTTASSTIPDNHLFLTNLSAVVGLERANVKILDVFPCSPNFTTIYLSTDRISPFTWLEAPGYSGRFSDNGFLMVESETVISYSAWEPILDWQKFRDSLTVRTLLDVYRDE